MRCTCARFFFQVQHPRQNVVSPKDGDDDVLAFCDTEDAMAYRGITCVGNPQITRQSLQHVSFRCPWMRFLHFECCEDLDGYASFCND
jgi:hypothetical protein